MTLYEARLDAQCTGHEVGVGRVAELAVLVEAAGVHLPIAAEYQGLTIVPISAQPELTLPLPAQLKLTLSPTQPKLSRGCGPKVLKLSTNVSDVSRTSSS